MPDHANRDRSATPGRQTLIDAQLPAPAAPGKRTLAEQLPPAQDSLPRRVIAYAGETVSDGGGFTFLVLPEGTFEITATPPEHAQSMHQVIAPEGKYAEAWKAVARKLLVRPPAHPAAPTEPETPEAPPPPADPSSRSLLGGVLDVVEEGVERFVGQIVDGAHNLWHRAVGASTPAVATPAPAARAASTPAVATPAPAPKAPAAPAADAGERKAMSQFIWYGWGVRDLGVTEVAAAAKVIGDAFGICTADDVVTEPDPAIAKDPGNNPNSGYWWFRADGTPTWSGATGGTQYVRASVTWSFAMNDVSSYLASNAPGARPAFMKKVAGNLLFSNTQDPDSVPVPASVQRLDLMNVPGPRSCFATSDAMLARSGVTRSKADQIGGIVTDETYEGRKVVDVTVDAAQSAKAKAYIDFETRAGRPVFVGVTYTSSNGNDDKITDHWVVIDRRVDDSHYAFFDPGTSSTKEAGAAANVFAWDGAKLQNSGSKKYVVSCIQPNTGSLAAWKEHWATASADVGKEI